MAKKPHSALASQLAPHCPRQARELTAAHSSSNTKSAPGTQSWEHAAKAERWRASLSPLLHHPNAQTDRGVRRVSRVIVAVTNNLRRWRCGNWLAETELGPSFESSPTQLGLEQKPEFSVLKAPHCAPHSSQNTRFVTSHVARH